MMKAKKIFRAYATMMELRVILIELICKVFSPKNPMDTKLPLTFTILLPIETDNGGFLMALFRGAIDNSIGVDVVNF